MAHQSCSSVPLKLQALAVGAGLAFAGIARGQAFNIDIGGDPASAPSASYGAVANQPGYWNSGLFFNLHDTAGNLTSAAMGGMEYLDWNTIAGASADDKALMEDATDSGSITNTSVSFVGLTPGRYRAYVYGWGGHLTPDGLSKFIFYDPQTQGGTPIDLHFTRTWPGQQVLGVTYFTHDFTIGSTSDNFGVALLCKLIDAENGYRTVMNGLQIVPIPAPGAVLAMAGAGVVCAGRRRRSHGTSFMAR